MREIEPIVPHIRGDASAAARVPLDKGTVRDLLEVKNIARLYEIWSFFAVARELERCLGPAMSANRLEVSALQVSVPWELEVAWANGYRLYHNRTFTRSHPAPWQAYSTALRPDVVFEVPYGGNAGLHLFDAKFRLDHVDQMVAGSDEREEMSPVEDEERQGTFKRADLYKMHTYHDAIPGVRSVWIFYPGTTSRFYCVDAKVVTSADQLPTTLEGVGAIPLRPDTSDSHTIAHVLRTLTG